MTTAHAAYVGTPHLRLTQRGRRVITVLVAAPLVVLALAAALNGGMATATDSSAPTQYVSVEEGQSLWQLAASIAPGADPRDVIAEIVSINQLDSAQIFPGQQLALPAQYTD